MKSSNMFATIILCSLLHFARSVSISVYADVFKDSDFFSTTFPWIIDNIGGEISVDFYLIGSGRYSVPQMCALKDMSYNTFLQSQYLKCEAEGYPSAYCLCETGIDPAKFKECVNEGGKMASYAASQFMQLKIGTTPLIEMGSSTVFEVSAHWYLKKICTIFGDHPPMGCVKPFECCKNKTEAFVPKRALAQFDKQCHRVKEEEYETTFTTYSSLPSK